MLNPMPIQDIRRRFDQSGSMNDPFTLIHRAKSSTPRPKQQTASPHDSQFAHNAVRRRRETARKSGPDKNRNPLAFLIA